MTTIDVLVDRAVLVILSKLEEFCFSLVDLPAGPVEENTLLVHFPETELGAVLSCHAVPSSFEVHFPKSTRVIPGSTCKIELVSKEAPYDSPATLASLLQRVDLVVSISQPQSPRTFVTAATRSASLLSKHLVSATAITKGACGIVVSVCVPTETPLNSIVTVENVSVAGDRVSVAPFSLLVCDRIGLLPPFEMKGVSCDYQTPCVSSDSRVYVPCRESLYSFGDDGKALMRWESPIALCAAAIDDSTGTMLLRSNDSVAAFSLSDNSSQPKPTLLWSRKEGNIGRGSIIFVPAHDVCVYASYYGDALVFLRLSDGAVVCSVPVVRPIYAAADNATGTIFAASERESTVYMWQLPPSGIDLASAVLEKQLAFAQPAGFGSSSPLVVMPPQPGCSVHYLIVAKYCGSEVCVFELPSLRLVFQGPIGVPEVSARLKICGIAADPCGSALVLSVFQKSVLAVPWPLPSMPPTCV